MYVTLSVDIEFTSVCGKYIDIDAGTRVLIDMKEMIAVWDGVYFDIVQAECVEFIHAQ